MSPAESLVRYPTFCGQNFLDTQDAVSYTAYNKKQVLINNNEQKYSRFKAGHPAGFIEAFANLYSDIADSLIEYKKTGKMRSQEVFSVELALEGLKMLEAMVESSHSKKWQKVELGVKEKARV